LSLYDRKEKNEMGESMRPKRKTKQRKTKRKMGANGRADRKNNGKEQR
jgi:hypothetical protein